MVGSSEGLPVLFCVSPAGRAEQTGDLMPSWWTSEWGAAATDGTQEIAEGTIAAAEATWSGAAYIPCGAVVCGRVRSEGADLGFRRGDTRGVSETLATPKTHRI
jgi:hypothetical protein